MSSHMGTHFLNSCVKVPIDPCNNCPAPTYNRPKVYLNRTSTPPTKLLTSNKTAINCELEISDTDYAANGMRSLATFYDSIPDYCEINHLPENEFYSTLERLKMTYRHLKSKPSLPVCLRNDSSMSLSYEIPKTIKKKKTASRKGSAKRDDRNSSASLWKPSYKDFCEKMKNFDYKRAGGDDEHFSKESTSPTKRVSPLLYKSLSMHHLRDDIQQEIQHFLKATQTEEEKPMRRSSSASSKSKKHLKKSFSFNDLNTKSWEGRLTAEEDIAFGRSPETNRDIVPNINVLPPSPPKLNENKVESSKGSHRRSAISTGRKKSGKHKSESIKVPFSFLGINECSIREKTPSVSPIHPVARPNLAATLRLQVSKKKVKELKSNCTFKDHSPQIDWEVRKTPAWKSLSHNESHKEILALRLATRKAEQEHQKRQYEMHMEIMRQRVKSAPLLLEGSTFWGPHVGKLSHSCHKDNLKHNCPHATNGQKKKKTNKNNSKKYLSNISYSRNSNHSTNLQESDDLSSLDRAYL